MTQWTTSVAVREITATHIRTHIPALQRAQNVTPHLYNTDYYITKLNRLKSSVYSSTLWFHLLLLFLLYRHSILRLYF